MKRSGFTLVELSIVLIIIGLLIGGILKGKAMIDNAKQKRVKSDVDAIVAAVYNYQDKYGYLPGDDPNDRTTDLGATGCTGGNGNGLFDTAERACAWQELIGAGLMSGDKTQNNENIVAKTNPYGGRYLFRTTGNLHGQTGNYIFIDNLPRDVARALDEKYDDGVWNTGDIHANTDYSNNGVKDLYWFAF